MRAILRKYILNWRKINLKYLEKYTYENLEKSIKNFW